MQEAQPWYFPAGEVGLVNGGGFHWAAECFEKAFRPPEHVVLFYRQPQMAHPDPPFNR
jgi:hypothetical protein